VPFNGYTEKEKDLELPEKGLQRLKARKRCLLSACIGDDPKNNYSIGHAEAAKR
jgi:hypothetical protein